MAVGLLMVTGLGCGCTQVDEAMDLGRGEARGDITQTETLARLPEPAIRRVDPPTWNDEQQRRQQEVERLLLQRYQDYRIVETTQTYSGDIIDWVDPTTVPGSQVEPPRSSLRSSLRSSFEDRRTPPEVERQQTELDRYPELRGPMGTIPIFRPRFEPYVFGDTDAESLDDFIQNHQASGQPAGRNRLYAGISSMIASQSMEGDINQFAGDVQTNTFSLIEAAVACRGLNEATTMELVGAVVSRDRKNFHNSVTRLQVEFLTRGGSAIDDDVGGWDTLVTGFIPAAGRPYGPGVLVYGSTQYGLQYEAHFEIKNVNGDWWIAHQGNWLGYYPRHLFDMLSISACESAWYGEVFDPTPTDWTWTDMGSGLFADQGFRLASYVRGMSFKDIWGTKHWVDFHFDMSQVDPACYTKTPMGIDPAPWERYFYLGGPGGDAAGCN
jgi:hypothetical protein